MANDYYWNYRVVEYPNGGCLIAEVYYVDGKIDSWCERRLYGDNIEDLLGGLALMLLAFKKPVLKIVENNKLKETNIMPDKEIIKQATEAYKTLNTEE